MDRTNASLFPFEYALMALKMKHNLGTATVAEAEELWEAVEQTIQTTHDTYYELLGLNDSRPTQEVIDQLENLYKENYAARSVLFDLYHLEQQIKNPNSLYRTWGQLPSMNEIMPVHREF